MTVIQGGFEARGRRFAVVASRFNDVVVEKLVDGATSCLRKHGIAEDDLVLVWVPGASMQARAIHAFRSVSPTPVTPSSVSISTTMVSCAELVAPTS